jgi:hypothetical protein
MVNVKEKLVNLYLCSTNEVLHHTDIRGSEGIDAHFLDPGISLRRVVRFAPLLLYSWESAQCTHWIGGGVTPRAGLDDVKK